MQRTRKRRYDEVGSVTTVVGGDGRFIGDSAQALRCWHGARLLTARQSYGGTYLWDVMERVRGEVMERVKGGVMERIRGEVMERDWGEVMERVRGEVMERVKGEVMERVKGEVTKRVRLWKS